MIAAVLGLDVSPLRLGYGLVTLDDGRALACGMERIDLPNKGWSHEQVGNALAIVESACERTRCEVSVIGIEDPHKSTASGGQSSFMAGRAVQEVVSSCHRRWPHAPLGFLQPSEWRRLAEVPPDPRDPDNKRRTIKGAALRAAVVAELDATGYAAMAFDIDLLPAVGIKPWVMATAMKQGFHPGRSQDAADAACIALATQRLNAATHDAAMTRESQGRAVLRWEDNAA